MNGEVGKARIGQWYLRRDTGEIFQVTALDEESRTIELQTFDGDVNEIEQEAWGLLPLTLAEAPQDWTGPVDDAHIDDIGFSEVQRTEEGWTAPLQSQGSTPEEWENALDLQERNPQGAAAALEELALEDSSARAL